MSEAMIVRKGGGSGGSINLQEKTVSPSTIRQEVTPSEGYGGLSKVNVEAIPNQKAAETYTPGLTSQTISAGQWLSGDQTIAAISPTKAAQVYTPTLEVQTIPAGRWLTGDQIIAAISPTKAAETYTPGTQNQVISAGRWLSGDQTILGDANLVAANIKRGVSIFGIAGSYDGGLSTSDAILKVITSTGCSVTVTHGTDVFTQQDADGFVRPNDAAVTEHFFAIPTAAFGTYNVKSTHPTYGDNEKQNAVTINAAGKVYEVLCGGKNIILDGTFGLQSGFNIMYDNVFSYNELTKEITVLQSLTTPTRLFANEVPVLAYSSLLATASVRVNTDSWEIRLVDIADNVISRPWKTGSGTATDEISGALYQTAYLYAYARPTVIKEIVLT